MDSSHSCVESLRLLLPLSPTRGPARLPVPYLVVTWPWSCGLTEGPKGPFSLPGELGQPPTRSLGQQSRRCARLLPPSAPGTTLYNGVRGSRTPEVTAGLVHRQVGRGVCVPFVHIESGDKVASDAEKLQI